MLLKITIGLLFVIITLVCIATVSTVATYITIIKQVKSINQLEIDIENLQELIDKRRDK